MVRCAFMAAWSARGIGRSAASATGSTRGPHPTTLTMTCAAAAAAPAAAAASAPAAAAAAATAAAAAAARLAPATAEQHSTALRHAVLPTIPPAALHPPRRRLSAAIAGWRLARAARGHASDERRWRLRRFRQRRARRRRGRGGRRRRGGRADDGRPLLRRGALAHAHLRLGVLAFLWRSALHLALPTAQHAPPPQGVRLRGAFGFKSGSAC